MGCTHKERFCAEPWYWEPLKTHKSINIGLIFALSHFRSDPIWTGDIKVAFSEQIFDSIYASAGGSAISGIIFSVIFLIVGMFLLVRGADMFVDAASKAAVKMKIPLMVIGLTVVAFGTSAPETAISINAVCRNEDALSLGNIIGSNILNILVILGISALITTITLTRRSFAVGIPFVIAVTAAFLIMGLDGSIGKTDSIILLVLFVVFFVYLIITTKKNGTENENVNPVPISGNDSVPKLVLLIIFGIVLVIIGSDITVTAAKETAILAGIEPRIIGLTALALGTSLPELATSISAARKKMTDLAVGNIIGSSIFNILFAGGLSGVISSTPIRFKAPFIADAAVAAAAALLLLVCAAKNKSIGKRTGIIMIVSYAVYFVYLIVSPMIFGYGYNANF